jgi:hypothetical protein
VARQHLEPLKKYLLIASKAAGSSPRRPALAMKAERVNPCAAPSSIVASVPVSSEMFAVTNRPIVRRAKATGR